MTLRLQAELQLRNSVPFGANLQRRIDRFLEEEERLRKAAARTAQRVSRSNFKYLRPTAPQRAGRTGTGGKLTSFIKWRSTPDGMVELDVRSLDRAARHWPIHEIGTGKRAEMRVGGGRSGGPAGPVRFRTVRSQRGRRISAALVWAQPGGTPSPPGAGRGQQLALRSQLPGGGAPIPARQMTIRREIKGQHFIKKGSQAGFREYDRSVLAAARATFRKGAQL